MSVVKILPYLWSSVAFLLLKTAQNCLAGILGGLEKRLEQQLRVMAFCRLSGYPGVKYR